MYFDIKEADMGKEDGPGKLNRVRAIELKEKEKKVIALDS